MNKTSQIFVWFALGCALMLGFFAYRADAITFDNTAGSQVNSGSSISFGFTNTGNFMLVGSESLGGGRSTNECTYNGVSMTRVMPERTIPGSAEQQTIFYLFNPDVGSNTLECTYNSSGTNLVDVISYSGVDDGEGIIASSTESVINERIQFIATTTPSQVGDLMLTWNRRNGGGQIASTTGTFRTDFPDMADAGFIDDTITALPHTLTTDCGSSCQLGLQGIVIRGLPDLSVDFAYPIDSSSIAGDFSHWQIDLVVGSDPISAHAGVLYGPVGTEYFDVQSGGSSYAAFATTTIYIPKTNQLVGSNRARIFLYDASDNVIASSSQIQFSITGSYTNNTGPFQPASNPFAPEDFTTSTDSAASLFFVDCSAYDGIGLFASGTIPAIVCAVKKTSFAVLQFFFVPHEISKDFVLNSIQQWKTTFPFSLFFAINTIQQESIVEGRSTSTLSIAFPSMPFGEERTINFSDSWLSDQIGASNVNTLWNILLMFWIVLLIFAAAYVIHKL